MSCHDVVHDISVHSPRRPFQHRLGPMTGRAKNEAQPEDLIKIFRGFSRDLNVGLLVGDLDDVCTNFEKLMCDVLRVSARPTALLLQQASKLAWECNADTALLFRQRLGAAYQHCRVKSKSATSGKKLCPAVWNIGTLMRQLAPEVASLGSQLLVRAQKLQKRLSDPGSPAPLGKKAPPPISPESKRPQNSAKPSVPDPSAMSVADINALFGGRGAPSRPQAAEARDLEVLSASSAAGSPGPSSPKLMLPRFSSPSLQLRRAPSSSSRPESLAKGSSKCYFDSCRSTMVRLLEDGTVEAARLIPGEGAFASACFEGEQPFLTEIPSLLAQELLDEPQVMRRPASRVRKRPAAAMTVEEESDAEADDAADDAEEQEELEEETPAEDGPAPADEQQIVAVPAAIVLMTYSPMTYPNGSIGIRQKQAPKKQICAVWDRDAPKELLKKVANKLIAALASGLVAPGDAKQWSNARINEIDIDRTAEVRVLLWGSRFNLLVCFALFKQAQTSN